MRKKRKRKLSFKFIFILFLLGIGFFMKHSMVIKKEKELISHEYDWSKLNKSHFMYRYEDKNYYSRLGIDISSHQGKIDWLKVKQAGVQFAFIRVGYRGYTNGELHEDKFFRYNIQEAIKNNIAVGIYFFSQAISEKEAKEEADFTLERIRFYKINLPVVYDLEYVDEDKNKRIGLLSKEDMTKNAQTFLANVQSSGYQPMLYASTNFFAQMFQLEKIQTYYTWVAEYDQTVRYPYLFQFWQYSKDGKIDGIKTNVDLNIQFVRK